MWWFLFLPGALGECLFAPDYTGHVTIPNSVTTIYNDDFEDCTSMTSVTIPNTVTKIWNQAFFRSGLTTVTIPNSVTEIGFNAFRETPLESVVISNGVTSIAWQTFQDCTNLDNVIIPVSVTSIGYGAFTGCTSLKTIKILNNATSIETTLGWYNGQIIYRESFYQAGCPQELYVAGADLCNCLDCFDCTADFCGLDDISYCTDLSGKLACGVTGTAPMTANLSNWQTGDVTSIRSLFASSAGGNYTFNDPSISTWDLSSCTDFSFIFGKSRFDHPLYWNVSSGVNFEGMFNLWYKNQPLYFTPTSSGTNFAEMFYYAFLFNQPVGFLDTESGTNFTKMFSYARNFNQDVSHLKVRGSIKNMFENALRFNQPLTWDVSGVENFDGFLWMATQWSQDVSWWDVVSSNIYWSGGPCDARFTQNFRYAYRFLGLATTSYGREAIPQSYNAIKTLTCWQMKLNVACNMIDVSTFSSPQPSYNELCLGLGTDNAGCPHTLCHNNTDISGCSSLSYKLYCPMNFSQPASVAALDTSHITDLSYLFVDRFSVNPSFTNPTSGMAALPNSTQQAWGHVKVPIGNWNTSAVTSFEGTFWEAASFNQPLSWDTTAGTNFEAMFKGAHTFNQDLGHFSVQGSLASMFEDALAFDQPLQWNVSAVTNFSRIFYNASSFSHEDDIAAWDVSGGLDFTDAFSATGELPKCVVTEYRWRSDFNGYWCSNFDYSTATCGQLGRGNEGQLFYESDTYTGYQACPQCGQCELGVNLNATRVLRCWAFKSAHLTVPNPIQSDEEYDVECTTATASPTTASPTTAFPTLSPTTAEPTSAPTGSPTYLPETMNPTMAPTAPPTLEPTAPPSQTTVPPAPTTASPTPTTPAPTPNELSGCPDNWSDLCTQDGHTTIGRCWTNTTFFACVTLTDSAFGTCGDVDPRLSDCTDLSPAPTQASPTHSISWGANDLNGTNITINVGDTVTWYFDQGRSHEVLSGVRGSPSAGSEFSSGFETGGSFSHTFDTAGEFPYHCRAHSNMNAVITVETAPTPASSVSPPTSAPITVHNRPATSSDVLDASRTVIAYFNRSCAEKEAFAQLFMAALQNLNFGIQSIQVFCASTGRRREVGGILTVTLFSTAEDTQSFQSDVNAETFVVDGVAAEPMTLSAPDDGSSSSNTGMIVAIVVGAAFVVAVAVAVWWWRSKQNKFEFEEGAGYM